MSQPASKTTLLVGAFGLIATGLTNSSVAAFPANVNLSSLDGSNGTRIDGVANGDFLGYSVSKIGDFNGDGRDDFVIGAPNSSTQPGSAYVIYGTASGLNFPINLTTLANNEGFKIDGSIANSQLGTAVSGAGDLNGDGYADLLLGAPGSDSVYVVFGLAGGYSGNFGVNSLDGLNGFRLTGTVNSQLGYTVANAGDVNGDGLNDIIVGNGSPNLGAGYVLFGGNSFPAVIDTATLNGANGFSIVGAAINRGSFVVSGIGDINGDGHTDIAVGSWNATSASVIFGQNGSFPASVDLSNINGFTLTDGAAGSNFGAAIAGIGDINGDNLDDFAIGAPTASTNSTNNQAGKTFVVFGSHGFASTLNVSSLNGGNGGFQIYGAATRDRSGWSLAGAGDINGDGKPDLAIGAPYSSYNGTASGSSYVIFGKSGAFASPLQLTGNPVFVNHLDGNNGFQIAGVGAGSQSGWAVAGGGDINGDGAADLLIGARLASSFDGTSLLTNSGTAYLIYGQSNDKTPPITTVNSNPIANAFGWNNTPITFQTSAVDEAGGSGLLETRCALDPASTPASINDLTLTACAGVAAGSEGNHTFYAASADRAGNHEIPVRLDVKIDLTAPLVTVTGVKNGAVYRRGKVPTAGCSTSDARSGVLNNATLTVTGGSIGQLTAFCNGALDKAGNPGNASVVYTVK
ncbi:MULTISPECIES: beta strand repeat-containing protein [Methylomonas]|uniref:Bacterial Ig-like domain-containing protein n=2 Tax=Methylomonas TaxID=416 RepID=A0A140E6K7_9GAMM|nr:MULTISPECIES: FG-GAP-like repeat-containing protein [Methylomonas]AMK79031.1 hypothetical protein JT25_021525 [Methylomonas denitrificans]OAI00194.1 hypothetical protein A1342_01350 [Methylomonas methanica]TCV79176.1 FG-GAP repeat protein [Methylomonas methanica]